MRCGVSLLVHQTSGAEVSGLNPASPTMILMGCRIIVYTVENLRVERETYHRGKKDKFFKSLICVILALLPSHCVYWHPQGSLECQEISRGRKV